MAISPAIPETKILCQGGNYAIAEALRRVSISFPPCLVATNFSKANENCLDWREKNRIIGARTLLTQYNSHEETKMSYYHHAKCLLLICRHANGNAKAEFKLLGVKDADDAGFRCIRLCMDVKKWKNLDEEGFQPFLDLANDAYNELRANEVSRKLVGDKLEEYDIKNKEKLIKAQAKLPSEDEDERMDIDDETEGTEETEYETDDESDFEETDPNKLYVGKPRMFSLTDKIPELEFAVMGRAVMGKSVILLLQEHDDTLKCFDSLTDYTKMVKKAKKEAEKVFRLAARNSEPYGVAPTGYFSEENESDSESEEVGGGDELEEGEVDEYEYEEDVEDEAEFEEGGEEIEEEVQEVLQPARKRSREDFEDDFDSDFFQPIALRKLFPNTSVAMFLY